MNTNAPKNKKKILVVDDSALMRRVMCDIINSDERFQVVEQAFDGQAAYELLQKNQYDGVVLDVNMPKMNGIQFLRALQKDKIRARIMMASTDTKDGAKVTMEALDLGAIDFIEKPVNIVYLKSSGFKDKFLETLQAVVTSRQTNISAVSAVTAVSREKQDETTQKLVNIVRKSQPAVVGQKIVALACSTGGPKALQSVVPRLPAELAAPVLIVQHMPKGFTQSLAERLDSMSRIRVKEAAEGDVLENGVVYISMGGKHMNVATKGGRATITNYSNEDGNVEGALSYGALAVYIQISFTLIFDETFLADAFASDKFQLTASNLIGGVSSLISTAVTGKTYSVRPFVEGFLAAMRDPDHRTVIFQWGRLRYVGMMNELSAKYTMFNPNGEPIRAEVDVTMLSESLPQETYVPAIDDQPAHMISTQNNNDYLSYWTNRYNAIVGDKSSLSGKTIKNAMTSLFNL